MKKRMKNKKGFTLIELIVVIAILGILAAIAIPRLAGFRDQAAIAADRSSAAVICKAAETYAAGQNMDDTAKGTLAISTLVTEGLITTEDSTPQGTGVAFTLVYDATQGIFTVTNGAGGALLYPTN